MTQIKVAALSFMWLLLMVPGAPAQSQASAQRLPMTQLRAGMHVISAQVAKTDEQRGIGLMYRSEMPQHEGMLFVFDEAGKHCFWMRNTLMSLSIAFVTDEGRIVNIAEMQKLDDKHNHCATEPVRYALEMNQGWFSKRSLKAGSKLVGAPFGP